MVLSYLLTYLLFINNKLIVPSLTVVCTMANVP